MQPQCNRKFCQFNNDQYCILLCVLEASANEFSALCFLLLARSSSNLPQSLEGFRQTLVLNFIQIRQWVKNFPIDPHCKNCPLSAMLQWGSMEKFFTLCRILMKFRLIVRLMIEMSLSLIGQEVKIISPKICLH